MNSHQLYVKLTPLTSGSLTYVNFNLKMSHPEKITSFLFFFLSSLFTQFNRLTKKKKLDLILRGVNIDDEVFLKTNTTLTKAVQNFIIKTNRFSEIENKD